MTRVVVVAESGSVMCRLTAAIGSVPGWYVVRHGSGLAPLDRVVANLEPDLVVIGDPERPADALARLAEVRRAAPGAIVVMLSAKREPSWRADALRAGASAVLSGHAEPETLAIMLPEAIGAQEHRPPAPELSCERPARRAASRRRGRASRRPRILMSRDESAA
jgi:DNA-binding NarL/FixJ family response regulator